MSLPPLEPNSSAEPLRDWEKRYRDFEFRMLEKDGRRLPYRFHRPSTLEEGQNYPLVMLLHGYGERGEDNRVQLEKFSGVDFWEKYPCFVIAPQCPLSDEKGDAKWLDVVFGDASHTMKDTPTWQLQLAIDLLEQTLVGNPIDLRRVYIAGISMGSFATWEILQRTKEKFAAALPVCGGADLAVAEKVVSLPLWIFHGGADEGVKTQRSRDIVAAIRAAGGQPKYTEYPGVGHDAWTPSFCQPEVWDWLFAQRKS